MAADKPVLFITGAGSGMGQLAAKRALSTGWYVAAADVNRVGLDALGASAQLLKLPLDVTDYQAVEAAVADTEAKLGPITRVVNSAAIMPLGLILDQPVDLIHKIMDINYGGLVNLSKSALPRLLARGGGEFISFASMAGHMPIIYMGAYDASKFAVVAYTEVLYHENINRGVKFVCVCPPAVATPLLKQAKDTVWPKMFDLSPVITPEEVLDDVERTLQRSEFWSFPGKGTKLGWRMRRWLPDLVWRKVHSTEGR